MWDARYGEPGFAYGTTPNDFLASAASFFQSGPILCLAAGEGRNAVWLARQGFEVTAVDSSSVGMEKAQQLAADHGVTIEAVVADLAQWDIGTARWGGIVAIFCHLPPPLRRQVHASVVRGLAPGGVLVLEAYTPAQLEHRTGGPPVAALLVGEEELRAELGGLRFERLEETVRPVHEGRFHHGDAAVVQAIAHKP